MTTLAQRNLAAFTAIKNTHSVTVGGKKLEIQPPGLIEILEQVEELVSPEDAAGFAKGEFDIQSLLRKAPGLALWLGARSLAGRADVEELKAVEDFVLSLGTDDLFELIEGIISAIMPDPAATKKKLAALGARLGLVAA